MIMIIIIITIITLLLSSVPFGNCADQSHKTKPVKHVQLFTERSAEFGFEPRPASASVPAERLIYLSIVEAAKVAHHPPQLKPASGSHQRLSFLSGKFFGGHTVT